MNDKLAKLLDHWKSAVQLTNALYGLYKDQRQQVDSYESQIREAISTKPLTDSDWKNLRKRVEKDDPVSLDDIPF